MEDKSSYHSFIFEPLIFPEWLCIMILYAVATLIANAVMLSARSQFSEQLKTSESKFHSAVEEHKNYKLSIDHRNFLLRRHIQSLIQDISNLKVELDKFRPLASSLVPHRDRAASMALGPVSEVPAREYASPQNLAFMASGPVHQVLACANTPTPKCASMASGPVRQVPLRNGARAPAHTNAVAFMSAAIPSSTPAPKASVRTGPRSQEELNSFSKEEKYRGGIHSKEEKRVGRPVPGSTSFVRDARVDVTSSSTKKLLSSEFLSEFLRFCDCELE